MSGTQKFGNYTVTAQTSSDMFVTRYTPGGSCLGVVTVPNSTGYAITEDSAQNAIIIHSDAQFSDDRQYRYYLRRVWDETLQYVVFIGLNPSTANETDPDPTITRVIEMAHTWGYGGIIMLNLFTVVSADPDLLLTHPDPVGPADYWLDKCCSSDDCKIIFAWGAFPQSKERAKAVIDQYPGAYALVINADGSPRHPLYVKGNTEPVPFSFPK